MSDKVLVTTESIQKQLPIKRSSQQRGVQIFRETLILKASTQNLPPTPIPHWRAVLREYSWDLKYSETSSIHSVQRDSPLRHCIWHIFFGPITRNGAKRCWIAHISPLHWENGNCREVDERRLRAYIKNTLIICYLDEKGDWKRYYHFQFVNFSLDWINLFFSNLLPFDTFMALDPPPAPPFMANAILNFHFFQSFPKKLSKYD